MHLTGQPNGNHRSPGLGAAVHRAQLGEFYDSSTNDSSIDHQPVRRDFDDESSSSVEHHLAPGWLESSRTCAIGVRHTGRATPRRVSARSIDRHVATRRSMGVIRLRRRRATTPAMMAARTRRTMASTPYIHPTWPTGAAGMAGGGIVGVGVVTTGMDTGGCVGCPIGLGCPSPDGPRTPGGESSPEGSWGVGSKDTHVSPISTCGHAWASLPRTTVTPLSGRPGVNPTATRVGRPDALASTANAPANSSHDPVRDLVRKATSGSMPTGCAASIL